MADPNNSIHFGTDGWRGLIADDFTFANLERMSHAASLYFKENHATGNGRVLIGYDRRFLSRLFAERVATIVTSYGIDVRISETPLPTPAVSFSVLDQKASWGIVLTASHNPALYNGFKIKEAYGRSAPPEVTQAIEALLDKQDTQANAANAAGTKVTRVEHFDDRTSYRRYIENRLDMKLLRQYHKCVIFDHLYGVGAGIPELILKRSKMKIISLHAQHDPLYGGLHPEPIESELGELCTAVRRHHATAGIALDGDADRLGVVDDHGRYLTPHQVFPLLVLHCIENKGMKGKIVQAVSLGYLSERIANEFGLPFEEVPVGFKHVAERMLQKDFLAGGEESGGYAVRGGLPERDGILNGLLFLEMLAARKKTPSQLLQDLEKRFGAARFKRVDIHLQTSIQDRLAFTNAVSARVPDSLGGEQVAQVRNRDGVKIILKSGAWVLLRPSGTEPLVRTYAESQSNEKTNRLLNWAHKVASLS